MLADRRRGRFGMVTAVWRRITEAIGQLANKIPSRFPHWREEHAPYPAGHDRQNAAPCEIAPSLDSRPRSGYALPVSRTQRRFLIQIGAAAAVYRTGEKAVAISSLFSCRTGRT